MGNNYHVYSITYFIGAYQVSNLLGLTYFTFHHTGNLSYNTVINKGMEISGAADFSYLFCISCPSWLLSQLENIS